MKNTAIRITTQNVNMFLKKIENALCYYASLDGDHASIERFIHDVMSRMTGDDCIMSFDIEFQSKCISILRSISMWFLVDLVSMKHVKDMYFLVVNKSDTCYDSIKIFKDGVSMTYGTTLNHDGIYERLTMYTDGSSEREILSTPDI